MSAVPKPPMTVKQRQRLKPKRRPVDAQAAATAYERDGYVCRWCQAPGGHLDAHHVLRRSQGGKDEPGNLVSVHRLCHSYIHEHPLEAKSRGFLA